MLKCTCCVPGRRDRVLQMHGRLTLGRCIDPSNICCFIFVSWLFHGCFMVCLTDMTESILVFFFFNVRTYQGCPTRVPATTRFKPRTASTKSALATTKGTSVANGGCATMGDARVNPVREVFIVHVGGTRCGTSSTDHYMKIHVRITLTVECIRTCIV